MSCLGLLAYHSQRRSRREWRHTKIWRRLLGVEHVVIVSVELEPDGRGVSSSLPECDPGRGSGSVSLGYDRMGWFERFE